jgi:cytochrome c553
VSGTRFTQEGAVAMLATALLVLGSARPAFPADMGALEKKAALCAACHGPGGNSTNPAIPSLARQPKQFITTQLIMLRLGNRKDPQMSPIAGGLSDVDMDDFGTYFSSQPQTPAAPPVDAGKLAEGRRLAEQYNCVQCHGRELKGQQHIPRLAGQQAAYLATQLRGFKAGTRFDMDGVMTSAVQALPEKDIEALAQYLAGLR